MYLVSPQKAEVNVAEIPPFQVEVGAVGVARPGPASSQKGVYDVWELVVRNEYPALPGVGPGTAVVGAGATSAP